MKKIITCLIATISVLSSAWAQKNNPYNATGADFVTSLKTLQSDYDNGKVKSITKETTDYYLRTLPIKADVNPEVVSATVNAMKNSNYAEVVTNSKLSAFSKDILVQSQKNAPNMEALVEKVKLQKLSAAENELVLKSLAITYNLNQVSALSKCSVNGQTGPNACQAVGALTGLIIGDAICGPICGIGGALIGAIWGSIKD